MTFDGRTATTLVMLGLFSGACVLSLGLPQKAAFMPLLIGVPGVLLCFWQLVIDLRRPPDVTEKPASNEGEEKGEEGNTELEIFFWLAVFSIAIVGFGFVLGGPVAVLGFVRFASKESWQNALTAAAGTFAVIFGVFIWLLELPLFQGLVLEALL